MTADVDTIMAKFARGWRPEYVRAARCLVGLGYRELVAIVRHHCPEVPPEATAASDRACAIIAAGLGASRMVHGTSDRYLNALMGEPTPRWSGTCHPRLPCFDHCMT